MAAYIDQEAAISDVVGLTIYKDAPSLNAAVEREYHNGREWIGGVRDALVELCDLPAADVVERPRWIPVTERLPDDFGDDVLVTDGEGYAVGFWREDAKAWDSADFGWLENRSEPPCGIHTVTHWMPLPPLPEPPKEE